MKIVVIGGSGLVGSTLVTKLREQGHETLAASPASGVNTLTGQGLAAALEGASVVTDVSNAPYFEDAAVLEFFETSSRNLLAAESAVDVGHHVALSVVGTERLQQSGYFRAKMAQEKLIEDSPIPDSIVHATQFFEFVGRIADAATSGNTVRLAHVLIQPMAADDVASALADVTVGPPVKGIIEIAGPQQFHLDDLVRNTLRERQIPARSSPTPTRPTAVPNCRNAPSSPRRRRPPRQNPLRPVAEPVHHRQQLGGLPWSHIGHRFLATAGEETLMSLSRTARRISLPALLAVLLAAALLAIAPGGAVPAGASAGAAAAGAGHSAKPVIVLEHGAWADASSWNSVISRLQRSGFTVYAPPNPLRGLPQDSAYLHQFLTQNAALQGQPVVLVAHSYGGAVITNAAVGDPEVRALVYVDAFIPDQGDTIGKLASGSCLGSDSFNPVPYPGGPPGDVDLYIKPNVVPGCFATGLPASQAALIAATQRPLAASAFNEPSGPPAWKTIPSWAVIGTGDQVIPPAELTFMAKRAGARITDVKAGHLSLISKPQIVTRVILQAVQATG